ncbi:MAG: LLM class flavin-dependent oxidoreductase, partial [Pseudomonadota bacterium]|nr:LLM class flavin-dependent oxidoreductase [Pseudomonadota bacterium]
FFPLYFGSVIEATVRLTGEIAVCCLPLGFMPGTMDEYKPWLEEGFKRAGNGKGWDNFEIQARVFVDVDEDVKASIDRLKPREALYIGGMGHKDKNFHKDMFIRRGYKNEADRIQELYLAGHKEEAIATIPDEWIDSRGLMGPPDRIKQRFKAWEDSGATSITVAPAQDAAVDLMAELARLNPPRD